MFEFTYRGRKYFYRTITDFSNDTQETYLYNVDGKCLGIYAHVREMFEQRFPKCTNAREIVQNAKLVEEA